MPHISDPPIVVRFSADAGQWDASFEGIPQVAFGGDTAIVAIRRLLEGAEAGHDTYTLQCDWISSPQGQIPVSVIWDPPELLIPCPDCKGSGQYVGLLKAEICGTCGGRTVVPP